MNRHSATVGIAKTSAGNAPHPGAPGPAARHSGPNAFRILGRPFPVQIGLAVVLVSAQLLGADDDRQALMDFENHVRPLLLARCVKCHGQGKAESGLRLHTRQAARRGGDSGPAILPGQPRRSLLIQAVRHQNDLKMPPNGMLNAREIAILEGWIQRGAVWPADVTLGAAGAALRGGPITDAERRFWSLQPIADPPVPQAEPADWIRNDIDRFVLKRLADAGLKPQTAASKRALIRRAAFDLTGLPPTPEQIRRYLADDSPQAFSALVDRLLATRAYGERWGRHWLDVVRYADTAGETGDYPTPLSYKYRNWVIQAFNDDKPYDEFLREQIAGDILGERDPSLSAEGYAQMLTATGFIAISRRFGFDVENYHNLTIQDTIDTIGQSVLGLSIGCARCHDHKYDPINVSDYYAWYGILESTRYSFPGSEQKKRPYDLFPDVQPARAAQIKQNHDAELAVLNKTFDSLSGESKRLTAQLNSITGGDRGFENQPLNRQPASPWTSIATARVLASAQSPFTHVFPKGSRGIALPRSDDNNHFGQKIVPRKTAQTTPHLYFNLDFRNTTVDTPDAAQSTPGSYRIYLGHGPGTSAAVELGVSRDAFFTKNGSQYEAVCSLKTGQWHNLQLTLDLKNKTYSGTIRSETKTVAISVRKMTSGWNGIIDQFFVDRFGHLAGVTPARQFDNYRVSHQSFAEQTDLQPPQETTVTVNPWRGYLEPRLLRETRTNDNGKTGFHVWCTGALPIVGANTSGKTVKVPGTVPPKSLVVHPPQKNGVAVAWLSPLTGHVKISGRVIDAHNCGDSVLWHLDHLCNKGLVPLAHGSNSTNGRQSLNTAAKGSLERVAVNRGDFIQLVILPKAHYGCDLTQLELRIEQIDGDHTWDLVNDSLVDFLGSNPHPDRYEHPQTWYFYEAEVDRGRKWSDEHPLETTTIHVGEARQRLDEITTQLASLKPRRDQLAASAPYGLVYGAREKDKPVHARVQIRGNKLDLGDEVPRRNLEILGNEPVADSGSGRLELADWLTRPQNPLTARVMVNRIWQHHFGRGLVGTENDFGARGERPTHPQLLDWLATRFREHNWSIKSMHRLIMLSATYQQSGAYDPRAAAIDPDARLLWRYNRRRLSAEEIRDAMLLVSGQLDPSVGAAHPFPAVDTWSFSQHAPFYGVYPTNRRSIYLMQQRLKRHPFLALFDGADPNISTAQRALTTVPTQALYLMNSEFVHTASQGLAQRLLRKQSGIAERLNQAYLVSIGRPATQTEQESAKRFLSEYLQALAADSENSAAADAERMAWAALARTLLVGNDFLFVD